MNHFGKIAVCLAGGLALHATLRADGLPSVNTAFGNPYTPIVDRNVFGLVPPPPPVVVDPNAAAEANLPKITANGIMSVFGNLKVLFKVSPDKPGGKDSYYDLAEGQSEDNFEVIHIDNKADMVTFKNHGVEQQIALVTEASGGGGGGGSPAGFGGGNPGFNGGNGGFGRRFSPGGFNGNNGGYNGQNANNGYNGGFNGQNGQNGNGSNPGFNGGFNGGYNGGGNGGSGGNSMNVSGFNFGQAVQPSTPATPAWMSQITPEEQPILIEANAAVNHDEIIRGTYPPLPPTVLTAPDAQGVGGAPLVTPPPIP